MTRARAIARLAVGLLLALPIAAGAQSAEPSQPPQPVTPDLHAGHTMAAAWTWSAELNGFAGVNDQRRKFRDFRAWESQNWLMASGVRRSGSWTSTIMAGGTLEPFTLDDLGSPQVFQTGETYGGGPLIDYQHPHDVVMHLGVEVARQLGAAEASMTAALVGGPPLGPTPFMHRASAIENPQVPLSHHQLDSTHITSGLVGGGVRLRDWRIEAAVFHGREPDERRTDLDTGPLDSQSVRLSYGRGRWSAQASAAWLTRPERLSTYDAERRTASVSYTRDDGDRVVAWTLAAGQNREVHGNLEAYLFEAVVRPSARWATYARAEWLDKDILDAGFHPIGIGHRHRQSRVGAITLGGVRDLLHGPLGRVGVGADLTVYQVPANLRNAYGSPVSTHVFVRVRGRAGNGQAHVH